MKLLEFFIHNRFEVLTLTWQHVLLVAVATGAAIVAGLPVGIFITRRPGWSQAILGFANILQTIPSLALFGFLIPLLGSYGIGRIPAIIALFLYSLLPIIQNTFTGIKGVDPAIHEAARGMGMTDGQLLWQVELPLSLPVIIAGVRVATVIAVGTATIAAAIGAGGLGMYIFRGLRMNDNIVILAGAIPAALMALTADFVLGWIERWLSPTRGVATRQSRKWIVAAALVLALGAGFMAWSGRNPPWRTGRRIIVGSKDFTEQVILGELVAQQIERRTGLPVERKFELAGDLCHRALVAGEIDVYVEYTGTAFTAILKHPSISDPQKVYDEIKNEYAQRFNLVWLTPLGFNNTFAILVRGDDARRLNLKSISDGTPYAPHWRAGFGQDFMSRQDGYPGFAGTYHLKFAEPPREMDLALTYRALAEHQVDLIAGNSTDGLIDKLHLVQLEDDRHYFPPYQAAPVIRRELLARSPQVETALNQLAGAISEAQMRRLNYEVDSEHRAARDVIREFLEKR